jgi:hypothetical protein
MIWGKSEMMSNLIDSVRDLGRWLHSHLAAAATMFPFLMAPGRCVPIGLEIPRLDRSRVENEQAGSVSMDGCGTPWIRE